MSKQAESGPPIHTADAEFVPSELTRTADAVFEPSETNPDPNGTFKPMWHSHDPELDTFRPQRLSPAVQVNMTVITEVEGEVVATKEIRYDHHTIGEHHTASILVPNVGILAAELVLVSGGRVDKDTFIMIDTHWELICIRQDIKAFDAEGNLVKRISDRTVLRYRVEPGMTIRFGELDAVLMLK